MQRAEAERWLGIAAKLLAARDFHGSKTFALKAREVDQNNLICDQILAVVDTVLAGEKRVNTNQQPDWYSVLQLPQLVRDGDVIADNYRKLVVCLNPERNKFPFADYALQLVVDAWGVLSDPNKKWLFDCQLGLFLQSQGGGGGGGAVGEVEVDPVVAAAVAQQPQQQLNINVNNNGGGGGLMDGGIGVTSGRGNAAVGGGGGGGGGGYQLNTFQLFQGQPEPPQQQQQNQQMFQSQIPPQQQQMWQSQAQTQTQNPQQQQQYNFMHVQSQPQPQAAAQQQQQQQQMNFMPQSQQQHNFMHVQSQPQPQLQQQHNFMPIQNQSQSQHHNFMPIQNQPQSQQWQMQDAAPLQGGGGGERNKGILNAIGGVNRGVTQNANVSPTIRPVPRGMPQGFLSSTPVPMARVAATTRVGSSGGDGNASGTTSTHYNNNSSNWNFNDRNYNTNLNDNDDYGNFNDGIVDDVDDENDEEDVVDEVDGFWTACPYCFYVFEYEKMYLDCALRCQICRRGFHAVQIPKPPPFASEGGGGGNKEKKNPFCTWGFFPLGFSMKAWKKQIKAENMKGSSSWEPFTPLISCPVENVGGGFKWFDADDGNALVGPKGDLVKSTPWVYIDDDGDVSEPSDADMSDGDWRTAKHNKRKRRRSTTLGGHKVGRPRKDTAPLEVEVVLALSGEDKSDARKTVSASRAKKLNSKNLKNVGRLDLNVEFNNNGEDHAPRVNAVNREEDGIENIAFFEGLDEFMSSLPILNVNGDGKTKPS